MDLRVLGVLTLEEGRIQLAPRDRLVLAALAVRIDTPVTAESLAAALWGEDPPTSWSKVIPGCIMRLRRLIAPASIETSSTGYRLVADGVELDAERFERLIARGGELLELGEPDRAAHALAQALALWRGQPFSDLPDWEPAQIASYRLDEMRLASEESVLEARLQTGELLDVVAQARARVAESPMRERRWVILGLAQYRQGRQADALASVRRGRELLAAELGLDPCAELAALEHAILRQDPELQSGVAFRAPSTQCPYFGLPPAGLDDAERYFGREAELDRGRRALEEHGVLIVSGSSGVGKSSFVRAGIGARIAARGTRVSLVTPGERPAQTLRELEGHDEESLLIVDQCEQAFANDDPDETRQFFDELGRMVFGGPVVMAIRADRLGDLADLMGFAGLIQSHLLMLGPLSAEGLRAIIQEPARQAGLILEPGLVEILLRDAAGGNLPLLSHALRQVWQRREGRVLSVDGYRASGEIRGAVAQTAEELFAELSSDGARDLRDILLRLVEPSRGGGVICQRVDRAFVAIDDAHARVAASLVDARLVTSDEDSFQLAHEAVAREWPRLREWLADDVEGQRIMRHVNAAANAWDAMGQPDSELYRGARLSATVQWRESARPVLAPLEAEFVDAALEREAADRASAQRQLHIERRSVKRLRWLVGATASLAAVALAVGTVAVLQAGAANEQAVIEDARRVAALASAEPAHEHALLLAVEAIRLWDAPVTRRSLLEILGRNPSIESVTRTSSDLGVQQMSLAPDGTIAVVVDTDLDARVIDIDRRTQVGEYFMEDNGRETTEFAGDVVLDAVEGPDGRIALSVLEDPCQPDGSCGTSAIRALDLDDPARDGITFTGFNEPAIDIEFSPDQSLAAAIAPLPWIDEPGNVAVWRVDSPDEPIVLNLPQAGSNPGAPNWANAFGRVRFSPDGSRLYASGFGPTAVFDTRTGALVGELAGEGILAVSPGGESVLIREGDTAVRIIDLEDPSRFRLLETPNSVIDGAFSPDGRLVVTTGEDGALLWSAGSGALMESLDGHVGPVTSAAFLPTGELVTAGTDGALITWTLEDWTISFRDWIREANEDRIPRDERTLVYEQHDGTMVGISADPNIWLDRACAVAGRALTEQEWSVVFESRPYDPACEEGAVTAHE
ncbi:BTAD domain-containing putative transcriptional regulator [Microbacterium sp. cf046]|uniref:nSTAND1 domain-containing NTPase n=1 Tax=Microbacterium sp. cf046 TaxID=1761803 RepID=UPI0015870538|nr:BTAD domain-containing putative transcriptional regulator [Microbacterium sp. cf046]